MKNNFKLDKISLDKDMSCVIRLSDNITVFITPDYSQKMEIAEWFGYFFNHEDTNGINYMGEEYVHRATAPNKKDIAVIGFIERPITYYRLTSRAIDHKLAKRILKGKEFVYAIRVSVVKYGIELANISSNDDEYDFTKVYSFSSKDKLIKIVNKMIVQAHVQSISTGARIFDSRMANS